MGLVLSIRLTCNTITHMLINIPTCRNHADCFLRHGGRGGGGRGYTVYVHDMLQCMVAHSVFWCVQDHIKVVEDLRQFVAANPDMYPASSINDGISIAENARGGIADKWGQSSTRLNCVFYAYGTSMCGGIINNGREKWKKTVALGESYRPSYVSVRYCMHAI